MNYQLAHPTYPFLSSLSTLPLIGRNLLILLSLHPLCTSAGAETLALLEFRFKVNLSAVLAFSHFASRLRKTAQGEFLFCKVYKC